MILSNLRDLNYLKYTPASNLTPGIEFSVPKNVAKKMKKSIILFSSLKNAFFPKINPYEMHLITISKKYINNIMISTY